MNKKFLSAILFGALRQEHLYLVRTTMMTSIICKDKLTSLLLPRR